MIHRIKNIGVYKLVQLIGVDLKLKENKMKKKKINLIFWSTVKKAATHYAWEWTVWDIRLIYLMSSLFQGWKGSWLFETKKMCSHAMKNLCIFSEICSWFFFYQIHMPI